VCAVLCVSYLFHWLFSLTNHQVWSIHRTLNKLQQHGVHQPMLVFEHHQQYLPQHLDQPHHPFRERNPAIQFVGRDPRGKFHDPLSIGFRNGDSGQGGEGEYLGHVGTVGQGAEGGLGLGIG